MSYQKRIYVRFLPAIFVALFLIGVILQLSWMVYGAFALTVASAMLVCTLFSPLVYDRKVLFTATALTVIGSISWPLLPPSSINVAGLIAMILGSLLFLAPLKFKSSLFEQS